MAKGPIYRRILLKMSGEALMGSRAHGLDPDAIQRIACEVREIHGLPVEVAMEGGSLAVLDTVIGPKLLPQAIEVNDLARILALVRARKATMTGGMPVLCGHDEIEMRYEPIGDLHNGITLRNGQRSAGHEIVLQINKD